MTGVFIVFFAFGNIGARGNYNSFLHSRSIVPWFVSQFVVTVSAFDFENVVVYLIKCYIIDDTLVPQSVHLGLSRPFSGMPWAVLGCPGLSWDVPGRPGMSWDVLGWPEARKWSQESS